MPATAHQVEKYNEVNEYIKAGHKRIRLIGSAGTGKTWLSAELVRGWKRDRTINPNYNNGHVYVTAPTNKALGVLQSKIDADVQFKTIHSACRLSKWVDYKTGIAVFKKQSFFGKRRGDEFEDSKIAIVDECSMLNSDFLGKWSIGTGGEKEYIKGYLEDYTFPIVFIGDAKQLNPVGEDVSPIWLKDWPTVELTEIIRQGAGNPIIELSRDMDLIYFKTPKLVDGKGYIYSDARQSLISDLAEVNGTDELKYLSYTNSDVDGINLAVRAKRYGNPKKIEKEETIVFDKPHGGYYTSKEVKVEGADVITDYVYIPTDKTKYDNKQQPLGDMQKIKMKWYRVNDSFNVVHEHSEKMYTEIFNTLKENNRRFGWDGRGHHYFEGLFADVTYNHALTIHKSQGSTFKETILNIETMAYCKNPVEKQRLMYTGITRASDLIILNNVK